MQAAVHRLSAAGPSDTAGLDDAIAQGLVRPETIVAVLGKTEGNGCVNDFTRTLGYAAGTTQTDCIAALFCKAEASLTGTIRGHRHVMLDDSDINATRHARALVGGVLAGRIGDTRLFVSGGAEHQGPQGGGPLAVIVSLRP